MQPDESVTAWIDRLRAGDPTAAQLIWKRYFERLVELARKRLGKARRVVADEEDVALSALASFCRAAEQGRFPQLLDRHGLWRLLVVITERKAVNLLRTQQRAKRGGGRVFSESELGTANPRGEERPAGLDELPSREPTPEFAALIAEECERLLRQLDDAGLQRVALLKLEGCANEEIAEQLGCALRTIERKLSLIRDLWEHEVPS
jgi:DNA-directed RNA polymerase specialized sigma24 family protein